MSAFEVTITPTRLRNGKRREARSPTAVCMAPFSSKSIVEFQDVPLEKTAKRLLRILNPTDEDLELHVTKTVPVEYNLSIEWTQKMLPAMGEVHMELIWMPQMDVASKEKMQITDSRNFRKDIEILFKTKSKEVKTARKFPTLSTSTASSSASFVRTMRLKSPKNNMKPVKKFTNPQQWQQRQKMHAETKARSLQKPAAPAVAVVKNAATVRGGKCLAGKQPLMESNTLITSNNKTATLRDCKISPINGSEIDLNVSKENISPLPTTRMLDLIDNLNFTPAENTTKSQARQFNSNNLTFLPTPLSSIGTAAAVGTTFIKDEHKLKPRRLTAKELEDAVSPIATCAIAQQLPTLQISFADGTTTNSATTTTTTNKTFDVNSNDEFNLTHDLLDASAGIILNRTTTIQCTPMGRTLTMISEEDAGTAASMTAVTVSKKIQQKQSLKPPDEDLKRDIKLIATPLRKYSESMKDLSLKSPQKKLAIQGSMPNLNEMESIRSFEQNRYFHQNGGTSKQTLQQTQKKRMSTVLEQSSPGELSISLDESIVHNRQTLITSSQHDLNFFNQQEITAQSSRFNLHEVGRRSPVFTFNQQQNKASSSSFAFDFQKPSSQNKTQNSFSRPSLMIGQKRSLHDSSLWKSFSNDSLTSVDSQRQRLKASQQITSPPKRLRIESNGDVAHFQKPTPINASRKDWSRIQPKKVPRLSQTLSLTKRPTTPRKNKPEEPRIVKLYDPDTFLQSCINPDPFAATTTCDPFLASTMYLDQQAVERHMTDFRKWLNALVAIPADLDADSNTKIDVGRLFNEVRNKDLTLAPTKEEQSMNYLNKFRLDTLRRAAVELFMSEEIRLPCSKIAVYVTKQVIGIRNDRNLHLDVVMQRNILELLLCFNPLWLRLGLEVVFGEQIHLQSNRDVVGLSTFILNRLFRDKLMEQKYSKAYTLSDEYAEYIKKFTLQKMLFLLLFLDKAQTKRIIKHNPCLFVKKSPYKETREILLKLSTELLAKIGDITRELKRFGYVLEHKQSYLDEFDYAFNNLAVDLRDGVRLTRVIEIILLRDDLTQQLRVPAISRLQRIFNVNLGLRALSEADFQLAGNITASDIVDGHREKTLSVLWQIIFKFRSPRFHAAARTIQNWWRLNSLRMCIRRRIQLKVKQRREMAATKLQAHYRGCMTRCYVQLYKAERTQAALILQKHTRRLLVQRRLVAANNAALAIQRYYRAHLLKRQCREQFLYIRECTIFLQRVYRRRLMRRQLLRLAEEVRLQRDQRRQAAALHIQCQWRAWHQMRAVRENYLHLRQTIVVVQQRFKARQLMRHERAAYVEIRRRIIFVQQTYRAKLMMRFHRQSYLQLRAATINLQLRRRAQLQMRVDLRAYHVKRTLVINMQRRVRAKQTMIVERAKFQRLRAAAVVLQHRYRACLAMRKQRAAYQCQRNALILLQRKWRATQLSRCIRAGFIRLQYHAIMLQQHYRANKQMQIERANFVRLRAAAVTLQRRYRAKRAMIKSRNEYQQRRDCVTTLQRHYRAYKAMRFQRAKFQGTRNAAVCLQQHIRGYLQMKQTSKYYQNLKKAAIQVQRAWRAKLKMRKQRADFLRLRTAVIAVQRRYRGKLIMRIAMQAYKEKRRIIIALQQRFRAILAGRKVRMEYHQKCSIIIKLQQRFRANQSMQAARRTYQQQRNQIISIQRYYRSYCQMKTESEVYRSKRNAALRLQRWYRAILEMRRVCANYQDLRDKIKKIQKKWRATLHARQERRKYLQTLSMIICIQRRYRAILKMRAAQKSYQGKRCAAIVLQQRYRARLVMLKIRSQYLLIVSLAVCIQRKWRARQAMRKQRAEYLLIQRAACHLQQKFRGKQLMAKERSAFLCWRRNVPNFQASVRGYLARRRFQALLTPEMLQLLQQKRAARVIQRYYRGYRVRKRFQGMCALVQIRQNLKKSKIKDNVAGSLRVRLQESVWILRGRYSVSEVLSVLQRLERLSRIVPHLLMQQSEFIATFCYGMMAQAIRSEIDKQMIELCSRIILNLARYDSINANTFQQNGLVTIAQMLLRWCDKDCEIFNTLCTLVWIFAHCPEKRKIIRAFMVTPEAIYMLRETKKLVARKEKMKSNDRRQSAIPPYSMRFSKVRQFSSRALPSLTPDFGIIQNKPYTFISSIYAFDSLLCILDVSVHAL